MLSGTLFPLQKTGKSRKQILFALAKKSSIERAQSLSDGHFRPVFVSCGERHQRYSRDCQIQNDLKDKRARPLRDGRRLQVVDDLVDHGVLGEEGDDAHLAATLEAAHRVNFKDLTANLGPALGLFLMKTRLIFGIVKTTSGWETHPREVSPSSTRPSPPAFWHGRRDKPQLSEIHFML